MSEHSAEPAQHNDGCAEWCNHCLICGVGILYGERCHAHLISTPPETLTLTERPGSPS